MRKVIQRFEIVSGRAVSSPSGKELAPAVCRAGYYQFTGEGGFTNWHVQSRALFWCKSGRGHFLVNGEEFTLNPQDLYLLPWDRTISYRPDSQDPMFTGHVHLVPYYKPGSEWIPNVPHAIGDIAYNSPDRKDADWPNFDGVVRFKINAGDCIGLLLDYIIRNYMTPYGKDEVQARHLGNIMVSELFHLNSTGSEPTQHLPEELLRLVAHVNSSYMRSLTVSELAEVINRSRSHVLKLFKTHLGISAKNYIINKQLKEACELLLSTTLSIAEVGQQVGIWNPYHFSKLFRKHLHLSPSAFRQNRGPVQLSKSQVAKLDNRETTVE